MTQLHQKTQLFNAMTLAERAQLVSAAAQNELTQQEGNSQLADCRMKKWRNIAPFKKDELFAQRLTAVNLTPHSFYQLLAEQVEPAASTIQTEQTWLTQLKQIYSQPSILADSKMEISGFTDTILPLIEDGIRQLRDGVRSLHARFGTLPFEINKIEPQLLEHLQTRLNIRLNRTMVLEMHVARLLDVLSGDTPRERFLSFINHIKQKENSSAFYEEYGVLARQLLLCIEQWWQVNLRFLERLCTDIAQLEQTFFNNDALGTLVQVEAGASDSHGGGQTVYLLTFDGGKKLVYKPKPLGVDQQFQKLLLWVNAQAPTHPFKPLTILERGAYGWTSFVEAAGCESVAEIGRFYHRQGGYLALFYMLDATDFHHENIIASGEHPMPIDLESLLEPHFPGSHSHYLNDTVMRVGILPQRSWANEEQDGIDISGFGSVEGKVTPMDVPQWDKMYTDQMQLVRQPLPLLGRNNRPTLRGEAIDGIAYMDAFITGFEEIYQLICDNRAALLADDGVLARFANVKTRVILRPTQTYSTLLFESFHPDVLRNGLERDRLFDQLWTSIEQNPAYAKIIPAEIADLWRGDIPIFHTRPNETAVYTSTNQKIPNVYAQSGLETVKARITRMGDADRVRQLWLIRAAFLTSANKSNKPLTKVAGRSHSVPVSKMVLRDKAVEIGHRIADLAVRTEQGATWAGLSLLKSGAMTVSLVDSSLYSGAAGIALFLAYLGEQQQEARFTQLAKDALRLVSHQSQQAGGVKGIGGFAGWGGLLYMYAHLGALWQEPMLWQTAVSHLDEIDKQIEQDKLYDLIGGAAGCIGGLLSLYHCTQSPRVLQTAVRCANWLVEHAQPQEVGIGWVPENSATIKTALTGFSHGAAGIAWALLQMGQLCKNGRFTQAALDAIAYERSLFSSEHGNWPDLREAVGAEKDEPTYAAVWCHGAPGIGLARLLSLPQLDKTAIDEIEIALQTTAQHGFGLGHSLCHGDLGNLDLYLLAVQRREDRRWQTFVRERVAYILAEEKQHGWICGNPLQLEEPTLMTGLAGIGYQLLRLADPERVPSLLGLQPPIL